MSRPKYKLYKKIVLLLIFTLIISCDKKIENTTYYADGTVMTEYSSIIKRNNDKTNSYTLEKFYSEKGELRSITETNREYEKSYKPWELYASTLGGKLINDDELFTYYEQGIKEFEDKTINGDRIWTKYFYENGQLQREKNFRLGDEFENSSVRHYYENGLLRIDDDYTFNQNDTIIEPYAYKLFDDLGRIRYLGIAKPITIAEDSDFDKDGKLWQLELDVYNESLGKRDLNGRMIGSIKLEHPAVKLEGKIDLKTGTREKGMFYSSEKTLKNGRWIDSQYRLFSGLLFMYTYSDRETNFIGNKIDYSINEKDLSEIAQIYIIKDGVLLVEMSLWMENPNNPGDFSSEFENKNYFTDFAQYLSVDNTFSFTKFYFNDIKSIEEKFEFRLGNFGTKNSDGTINISLSPFAYSYNDLIKSPQGKLVKAGN